MDLRNGIVGLSALIENARALSESVLDSDFFEARFRANLMTAPEFATGIPDIDLAATVVANALGAIGKVPLPTYAAAILRLSDAINDALDTIVRVEGLQN